MNLAKTKDDGFVMQVDEVDKVIESWLQFQYQQAYHLMSQCFFVFHFSKSAQRLNTTWKQIGKDGAGQERTVSLLIEFTM